MLPGAGREANLAAWRGYAEGFPNYVMYPHALAETAGQVAVLGDTTGSHLSLQPAVLIPAAVKRDDLES